MSAFHQEFCYKWMEQQNAYSICRFIKLPIAGEISPARLNCDRFLQPKAEKHPDKLATRIIPEPNTHSFFKTFANQSDPLLPSARPKMMHKTGAEWRKRITDWWLGRWHCHKSHPSRSMESDFPPASHKAHGPHYQVCFWSPTMWSLHKDAINFQNQVSVSLSHLFMSLCVHVPDTLP